LKLSDLRDLEEVGEGGIKSMFPEKPRFRVGLASCGLGAGAMATMKAMDDIRDAREVGPTSITGCIGACYAEPLVELYIPRHPKILYRNVDHEKGREIMEAAAQGLIKEEYAFCKIEHEHSLITGERTSLTELPPADGFHTAFDDGYLDDVLERMPPINELPFFEKQTRIVLRNAGYVDPENIDEYIARGGYLALHRALQMDSDSIIKEVAKSKLRGRGGAGFPTGTKWRLTKEAEGERKYVVSNGDEGDPGAYMDRVVLESDPHSMMEGMIIGAHAIGASQGYVFVRNEYPKAVERLEKAIEQARSYGLLGNDILGSGFDFDLTINRGGGAFVCGEETALLKAIEGRIPQPSPRPPYPAQSGLWGKPTLINNVKTWSNIPVILARRGGYLSRIGTDSSGGTKVFSLVGDVERRGLIEVELGITLREIVANIGNADLNETKAVQIGGPSGGFIPVEFIDSPVDFDALSQLGSIMGSGGMVVMDKSTCMVDMARYFLDFTLHEGCGQCTAGREGLGRMYEILMRITRGKARMEDLALLRELAQYVEEASLCGLGKTAPRPVLTTLDHFGEEYREHIEQRICHAGVCPLDNGGASDE
jgi:NADH-quinone oxidoreductase subunit F